jgi:hypothetical protein
MLPRERVFAALNFSRPDIVPLECHPSPAGLFEHGERVKDLWKRHPQDFGDLSAAPLPEIDPKWMDTEGRYCELRRDEWGVLWKHLIFGVHGHPIERPLDDWSNLARFRVPAAPGCSGESFRIEQARAREHRRHHFLKSGWISIFEVMHAVRRFENVLMDILYDSPEIHRLADLITEYQSDCVHYLLERGVDAIQFGDDFGTQNGLMFSRERWRQFFKPRYERLIRPIRAVGKKVFFHSCGNVHDLLDEFADLGVDALWLQLPLYDERDLAEWGRRHRIALALQADRSHLMTYGTATDVRRAVERMAGTFSVQSGGAWFYVEIDNGFPLENVVVLFEAISQFRTLR